MTKEQKDFIYEVFVEKFNWMDASDVESLYESLEEDVITDIEECADPNEWHNGDVCMAIRRVLFNRIGIDY